MVLSIYAIFTSSVLCANALAILSETRLLTKLGLATSHVQASLVEPQDSPRSGGILGSGGVFVPPPFDNEGGTQSSLFASSSSAFTSTGAALSSPPRSNVLNYQGSSHTSRTKEQIATLLSSVRTLLRWPLILINIVLILLAIILN